MSTTGTSVETRTEEPGGKTPRTNGLTDEQIKALMALAGRRKGDPTQDAWIAEVERYREQLRREEIARQEAEEQEK